ncbi:MAG: MBL fold metallo-hydrolase [Actinomycetota bacterium]|nr:MBL fold metallo-hydrolase [Actinomycetota bacterium]
MVPQSGGARDIHIIDTGMHGGRGITGAFIVRGERTALVETGPKSTLANVLSGLEAAGVESIDWIVVTHIHLDHAGAAGALAQRWPEVRVAVHELGAPHLADPSKLWASARRIYGDAMEKLWGGVDPVPRDRIEVLSDGDVIDLGGRTLRAVETPGHARHHHALLDDSTGALFAGDALGVRLPDVGVNRPATPPPEFDLEQAIRSIDRIRDLNAESLWLTHFGPTDRGAIPATPSDACSEAVESLTQWDAWVRAGRKQSSDAESVTRFVVERSKEALEGSLGASAIDRLELTTSYSMNVSGYMRAIDKAEAPSTS